MMVSSDIENGQEHIMCRECAIWPIMQYITLSAQNKFPNTIMNGTFSPSSRTGSESHPRGAVLNSLSSLGESNHIVGSRGRLRGSLLDGGKHQRLITPPALLLQFLHLGKERVGTVRDTATTTDAGRRRRPISRSGGEGGTRGRGEGGDEHAAVRTVQDTTSSHCEQRHCYRWDSHRYCKQR